MTPEEVVRAEAAPAPVPLVPEVVLPVAADVMAVWQRAEDRAGAPQPPPFWASPWAGGQALARTVLDRPGLVAGRRVVDVACGSGLVAVAAALAGAGDVRALDVDPAAVAAARWSAALNGVHVEVLLADALADAGPTGPLGGAEVVLVGDLFYERSTALRLLPVLRRLREGGADVLVGDPGRAHLPRAAFDEVARHDVPVVGGLEDRAVRSTAVLRPRAQLRVGAAGGRDR
ncbi:methyltransferase [uncultured Pseudokineococcus sp.]|uniref:class I SAM-dependent methyltransferase n=1 Tax=uncultured Pseudokineococcus sp. TaxID=1642928 RepID=UPI0026220ED2|nr:50S ribosomal protein L11 methyltransferase [uncultured Pseudokineococcus sp.]